MLEDTPGQEPATETATAQAPVAETAPAKKTAAKKAAAKKTAAKKTPAKKTAAKKTTTKKTTAKKTTAKKVTQADGDAPEPVTDATDAPPARKAASRSRSTKKQAPRTEESDDAAGDEVSNGTVPLFQAPDAARAPAPQRRSRTKAADRDGAADQPADQPAEQPAAASEAGTQPSTPDAEEAQGGSEAGEGGESAGRRRRRRGGRRRRKPSGEGGSADEQQDPPDEKAGSTTSQGKKKSGGSEKPDQDEKSDGDKEGGESSSSRRRRRRRRAGDEGGSGQGTDDPQNTVTKVRQGRSAEDQITSLSGSTRLEAKKQRRREGREAGRRRAPIVSEAEFLARRESVDRVMAIRQRDDLTQIAVLEDKVLVEHYVARESQTSLIGNVYLGRVQNVLPSMEAAFIDIGKGRNAVLYAGEVNWTALGHKDGQPRKIESVLSSGQTVMVQVTKDPVGHKGARLTSQISLAGRFLVYVPDGTNSGISRKLPDTERNRLKTLLKEIVPDGAGVIVRTAAEGASEEELTRDVERLTARWADIEKKAKGSAPQLLYGEPDLMLKVVRDLFTEDFAKLVVQGDGAWETVHGYVTHVAPDLEERLERHDGEKTDLFTTYRIDEQIAKGLDRKVWLPSGGSLIIDRTEAMTVVDVNTGKFTGSGGNLEETVTKNNLEAAEEMVRQLRLRDIGGIIVIDFIDMVLESNRDLVLRRLVECLGRDRTRHQVAEVTSLGLVQMTRKRIGTGLLEAFSETCSHCQGRGLLVSDIPVEPAKADEEPRRSRRSRGGKGRGGDSGSKQESKPTAPPSPKDVAAMSRPHKDDAASAEVVTEEPVGEAAEPTVEAPTPAEVQATGETAVEEAPAREKAADEKPADEAPAAETPAEEVPLDEPPVDEAPAEEVPLDEPPVDEAPAEEVPVDEAPVDEAPVDEAPVDAQPVEEETEAPRPAVVTRSRRRSARRPAGPPTSASPAATPPPGAVGSVGEPPESGTVEPGTAGAEPAAVEHVPVKKRGSRKR
ncbi:Rne/Rng family ribonuclease [Nocardioides sp. GXQ0305]|uniref:Rne/Rng family ribonuclease n=1 Tax=Nocardioides sp. GXQ0305 TaxID=3423912 RepID=UPI003D7DE337